MFRIDKDKMSGYPIFKMSVEVIRLTMVDDNLVTRKDNRLGDILTDYWRRSGDVPRIGQKINKMTLVFFKRSNNWKISLFIIDTRKISKVKSCIADTDVRWVHLDGTSKTFTDTLKETIHKALKYYQSSKVLTEL